MSTIPTPAELLAAGCHFGHRTLRWEPPMAPYIFGERGGIHIIDLAQTHIMLERAASVMRDLGKRNAMVVFVGSKPQARNAMKDAAERTGQPVVFERWLGGTFTNFSVIAKLVRRMVDLERAVESGEVRRYTKYEQGKIQEEIKRLQKLVGGIRTMNRLPDAIFVVGMREEDTAIREARRKKIPVIAICDSNNDPKTITHAIPANDDGVKSVELITKVMADAYLEGRAMGAKTAESNVAVETPTEISPDEVTLTTMAEVIEKVDVPPSLAKVIDPEDAA